MNSFLNRPLVSEWPYLWIDATYVKAREAGRILSTATIIAEGVNTDGQREVLGVAACASEAEVFWKGFLRSLADRGLRGVRLVIADDHKGLRAAATKVVHAMLQRWCVHWVRNASVHVPAKQRPAVIAMIKTIFAQESAQESAQEARAQWNGVADALRERMPRLAELMDGARDDVLAYTGFPKEHWPQISSTNPLERLHGEVKRRSDVVGIFPNDRSVVRLAGALMHEQNDEYGPLLPCKGFRLTTTDPVLAVVYPALSRGNTPQALMVFADRRPDKWTSSHRLASFH